ncbi:MAGE family-domain-containing protein [Xylariales sp. AK1849]|nr:MAGE family-domain-containing protein [Xylariales sp. AK1849]
MPPQTQRRRRTGNDEPHPRQSRREPDSNESTESEHDEDGDADMAGSGASDERQLVKKLVRYALACEYARMPIRRDGIRDKVLGNNARSFKRVFDASQMQLRQVFGMEMSELPVKEKRTLKEKQKANATQRKAGSQSTASSRSYILTSILPAAYKSQLIIAPSRTPSTTEEAEYVGFYTFVISLIVLKGGELTDQALNRALERMNASVNLPMGKTRDVLAKLVRQGYLDKVVQKSDQGEEDTVTWCVGTRAKVEVSPQSMALFVKEVWGELPEDFNKKLSKSLGLQDVQEQADEDEDEDDGEEGDEG